MTQVRLVDYENVPWGTIQGEGVFTGVPSTFVRLHGCDYSCAWCDSKKSWQEGSTYEDRDIEHVLDHMRAFRLPHAVITGGNPLLQVQAVCELIAGLKAEWVDFAQGDSLRKGMYVTVETQASIYSEDVCQLADFMSLSPKLHAWPEGVIEEYVRYAVTRPGKAAQVKIVVNDAPSTQEALAWIDHLYAVAHAAGRPHNLDRTLFFVLQPEWSTHRQAVKIIGETLSAWYAGSPAGVDHPTVRLMSQAHKATLLVR